MRFFAENGRHPLNHSAGTPIKMYPFLDLGLVEGPMGYQMHQNPDLRPCRKVKWEKIKISSKMAFLAKNGRSSINRSAGATVENVPFFRFGSGREASGLPNASNPDLEWRRKVKWEKVESFPRKRRIFSKIDGLL